MTPSRFGRMWRGPQEERRDVRTETEITIPNLAGISIVVWVALFLWAGLSWGRFWSGWFPSVIIGLISFGAYLGLGPDLRRHTRWRPGPTGKWRLDLLRLIAFNIVFLFVPPLLVSVIATLGGYGLLWMWFNRWMAFMSIESDFWWFLAVLGVDLALSLTGAYPVAAGTVVFFHVMNTKNPNWPAPKWYTYDEEDEQQQLADRRYPAISGGSDLPVQPELEVVNSNWQKIEIEDDET